MNLELIDPFNRQEVPDRIDSTLGLLQDSSLHYYEYGTTTTASGVGGRVGGKSASSGDVHESSAASALAEGEATAAAGGEAGERGGTSSSGSGGTKKSSKQQQQSAAPSSAADAAALAVSWNRRGRYLAVAYGSGAVACFDILNRSLAALYPADSSSGARDGSGSSTSSDAAVSWSRRSRTLLCYNRRITSGTHDVAQVRLWDATHPFGPSQCCRALMAGSTGNNIVTTASSSSKKASKVATEGTTGERHHHEDDDDDDDQDHEGDDDAGDDDGHQHHHGSGSQKLKHKHKKSKKLSSSKDAADADADQHQHHHKSSSKKKKKNKDKKKKHHHRHHPHGDDTDDDDDDDDNYECVEEPRRLRTVTLEPGEPIPHRHGKSGRRRHRGRGPKKHHPPKRLRRHPCAAFEFSSVSNASLVQVNPRFGTAGLAVLDDGSLAVFWIDPALAFVSSSSSTDSDDAQQDQDHDGGSEDDDGADPGVVLVVPLTTTEGGRYDVACAAFDRSGNRVYAVTRDGGTLLGYDVSAIWKALEDTSSDSRNNEKQIDVDGDTTMEEGSKDGTAAASVVTLPPVKPKFRISTGVSAAARHLLISRNGKHLVVNSSDGALRLFATKEIFDWTTDSGVSGPPSITSATTTNKTKPVRIFQDVVSKVKFDCCDLSGDGEYVVGGASPGVANDNDKYELYVWNLETGALIDKLTGSKVRISQVAWHPTRPFLAVATSDGLVDVWGPHINWTAFAPDFQALPMNVEYVEREDEFDVDSSGRYLVDAEGKSSHDKQHDDEADDVDVLTVEKVPVFASDSEDEHEVFSFETKVVNILADKEKSRKKIPSDHDGMPP